MWDNQLINLHSDRNSIRWKWNHFEHFLRKATFFTLIKQKDAILAQSLARMVIKWLNMTSRSAGEYKLPKCTDYTMFAEPHIWPMFVRYLNWFSGCQRWFQIGSNRTNLGLFEISFQYILAWRAKMYWKMIFKKSQICPIWCQSGPKWDQIWHARAQQWVSRGRNQVCRNRCNRSDWADPRWKARTW